MDRTNAILSAVLYYCNDDKSTFLALRSTCRTLYAASKQSHAHRIHMAEWHHGTRDTSLHFDVIEHEYTHKNDSYISVTTLCHTFFPEFDREQVLKNTPDSNERIRKWGSADPDEIIIEWERRRDAGTELHEAIEMWLRSDGRHPTTNSREFQAFLEFERDVLHARGWRAYRVEWRLYDEQLRIAGTIDALFYNDARGEFMLLDWKRTPKFWYSVPWWSQPTGHGPCADVPNSQIARYGLQLNIYAWLLRRRYGIAVDDRIALVRFHPQDQRAELHRLPRCPLLVNHILQWRRQEREDA